MASNTPLDLASVVPRPRVAPETAAQEGEARARELDLAPVPVPTYPPGRSRGGPVTPSPRTVIMARPPLAAPVATRTGTRAMPYLNRLMGLTTLATISLYLLRLALPGLPPTPPALPILFALGGGLLAWFYFRLPARLLHLTVLFLAQALAVVLLTLAQAYYGPAGGF